MEFFGTLLVLTAFLPFCSCRKNLEEFFEGAYVDVGGEKGRMIFPTQVSQTVPDTTKVTITDLEKTKIPESLLIAMNDVQTADEFIRRFVAREPDNVPINNTDEDFTASGAASVLGRKGLSGGVPFVVTAEFAGCRPQKTVVKVTEESSSDDVYFWPPCVYLNKCGGCCASELMTCRPTAISSVNVTVLQARYTGPQSNPFANEGIKVIEMEQHDKCACGCKELPEDCTPFQEYRKNECRCVCANQNELKRCKQRLNKFWDSLDCTCKCRNPVECSSGLFFSGKTCRCEMLRFALMARIGINLPAANETAEAKKELQPIRHENVENVKLM